MSGPVVDPNLAPAIVGGELSRLSVSQIKTAHSCQLKWWYEKIAGFKQPDSAATDAGKKAHKEIEHYLKTGQDVLGPLARKIKHLLPTPGPDLLVEQVFSFPLETVPGVTLSGSIDLINPRDPKKVVLWDHKTTKSIAQYAAQPRDLVDPNHGHGIQMLGYAKWLSTIAKTDEGDQIEVVHACMPKNNTEAAELRKKEITLADAVERWLTVELTAKEIQKTARQTDPAAVRANAGPACFEYRGCPHQSRCPAFQKLDSKELFTMSLADSLSKYLNAPTPTPTPAPTPAPTPTPTPAPTPSETAKQITAMADQLIAKMNAGVIPPAPASAPVEIEAQKCVIDQYYKIDLSGKIGRYTGTSKGKAFFEVAGGEHAKTDLDALVSEVIVSAAVLPPDAPAIPTQIGRSSDLLTIGSTAQEAVNAILSDEPEANADLEDKLDYALNAGDRGTPKKRGRPAKAATAPTPAHTPALTPAPVASAPVPVTPTVTPPKAGALHLFVNCLPADGRPCEAAFGAVYAIMSTAAKIDNVADYRHVDFGKGKGTLAMIAHQNIPQGSVWIQTHDSDAAAIIAETWAASAATITRGI